MSHRVISRKDLLVEIAAFVGMSSIPGRRESAGALARTAEQSASHQMYDLDVRWDRGWAAEASLTIRFEPLTSTTWLLVVRIGWSTTSRSPAVARAAVKLYEEVVDLACTIEAMFGGVHVRDGVQRAAAKPNAVGTPSSRVPHWRVTVPAEDLAGVGSRIVGDIGVMAMTADEAVRIACEDIIANGGLLRRERITVVPWRDEGSR